MAAVTICSDSGAQENSLSLFPLFPHLFAMKWWDAMILVFECLVLSQIFHLSSFTFIKRLFSSSSFSVIRVMSSGYLRLLIFLQAILISACASSSPAFCMIYSVCGVYHISLVAQMIKCLPTMQGPRFDTWVGKIFCRRKWQPTPVLLPGKPHGRSSMVGHSPWGRKESDMTEQLHFHFSTLHMS